MKIYVASSWRNEHQPKVVEVLRSAGHEVYDFHNPAPGNVGFSWRQVDPTYERGSLVTAEHWRRLVDSDVAREGHAHDLEAMKWADACVYVLPCGRSASFEAGWFVGQGKRLVVLAFESTEPELMFRDGDIVGSLAEMLDALTIPSESAAPAGTAPPRYENAQDIRRREQGPDLTVEELIASAPAAAPAGTAPRALTFADFSEVNRRRCESYNGFGESLQPESKYTLAHWALSIASEAGEVCDAILGWEGLKARRAGKTKEDIARELVDVITYCDLAIQKLGYDTGTAIVAKFNEVNERCGFGKRFTIAASAPAAAPAQEVAPPVPRRTTDPPRVCSGTWWSTESSLAQWKNCAQEFGHVGACGPKAAAPPTDATALPTDPYCELSASEIPNFGTNRDTHRCAKLHHEKPGRLPTGMK